MTKTAVEKIDYLFDLLFSLNPDREELRPRRHFLKLARRIDPGEFPRFRERTEQLITAYLAAPWKQSEAQVISKYLRALERTAQQLEGQKLITSAVSEHDRSSVVLVPARLHQPADWLRILTQADVPRRLGKAVDAATRRNRTVKTVLLTAFEILHEVDSHAAFGWELEYLEDNRGCIDPDLVRDLLAAWQKQPDPPRPALDWALRWSVDENLLRQWPAVVAEADRLLRNYGLQVWLEIYPPKSPELRHLKRILTAPKQREEPRLPAWLHNAVDATGHKARGCISLQEAMTKETNAGQTEALRLSLIAQLKSLECLFVPVLCMADLLLESANGAYQLALASHGISHRELQQWRERLQKQAYDIVQKLFLQNLREHAAPVETIRQLCLGDKLLFEHLSKRLDLLTKEFESYSDRDTVAETLAVNYASFRESKLLDRSMDRRYRLMARLLHEDTLRNALTEEQLQELKECRGLRELFALAADSRRYLKQRRALNTDVADMAGSELSFAQAVRQRRASFLRTLLPA